MVNILLKNILDKNCSMYVINKTFKNAFKDFILCISLSCFTKTLK